MRPYRTACVASAATAGWSAGCETCGAHPRLPRSLAYLHHLVKAHEPLAWQLLSLHNIHFMCQLAASLREGILADRV